MYYGASPKLFEFARLMRENPTEAEDEMWRIIGQKCFSQFKFRRQHPIANFIADFYCHSLKLVIEVDGGYHCDRSQMEFDSFRDEDMTRFSISVLRFSNADVLTNETVVVNRIMMWLANSQGS